MLYNNFFRSPDQSSDQYFSEDMVKVRLKDGTETMVPKDTLRKDKDIDPTSVNIFTGQQIEESQKLGIDTLSGRRNITFDVAAETSVLSAGGISVPSSTKKGKDDLNQDDLTGKKNILGETTPSEKPVVTAPPTSTGTSPSALTSLVMSEVISLKKDLSQTKNDLSVSVQRTDSVLNQVRESLDLLFRANKKTASENFAITIGNQKFFFDYRLSQASDPPPWA